MTLLSTEAERLVDEGVYQMQLVGKRLVPILNCPPFMHPQVRPLMTEQYEIFVLYWDVSDGNREYHMFADSGIDYVHDIPHSTNPMYDPVTNITRFAIHSPASDEVKRRVDMEANVAKLHIPVRALMSAAAVRKLQDSDPVIDF